MSRTTKRILSILLAAAMVLSLGITGWALDDDIVIVDSTPKAKTEKDSHVTEAFEGGTELELREIDPSELKVGQIGEIKAEDEGILTTEELPFGLNDIVRVSIVLDNPGTMAVGYAKENIVENQSAMSYRQSLRNEQAQVQAAIAAEGISINVKWNLTLAVNIISAEVRYGDIEAIEAIPGVKEVWLENRYEPQNDEVNTAVTTEYMVGATASWADGYTGAGSRIAIIDTGTNQDHISFQPDAFLYALDQDGGDYDLLGINEIKAVLGELNANNTDSKHDISSAYYVYKNAKVPFAYNYVDGNNITDHYSDGQGEHGSHVSGIAAANRYVKIDGEFVEAANSVFAVGVAPDAQILTMKVFGAGGGAYDSDYMAAIEDAIILKADSINLSLNSVNPGLSFSNGYQAVMDSLIDSGSLVCNSHGNSGSWADYLSDEHYGMLYLEDVSLHTGGSPGSYVNSFASASADNIGIIGTYLVFSNYDKLVFFNQTDGYGNEPMDSIAGDYEFVLVDGPGVDDNDNVGLEGDAFAALGSEVLEGKIAMCYRGSSSFFAKANAAAAQGAAGIVIINNEAGSINMNLTGYLYTAPAVSILKADGDAIKAGAEAVTDGEGNVLYYTGTVSVSNQLGAGVNADRSEATMSSFSAWGVPGSLILKPEITSPGGSIWSVNGMTDDGYEYMSGTSMASPHTAGMAAVLGQYIRENNLEELTGLNRRTLMNSLLMSTATPMIGEDGYVSILQQGSGLADVYAATKAMSYILMDDNATASAADGKVKAEFGQDAARNGSYSYSFTVNNFSDVDLRYEPYSDIFTQYIAYDGANFYLSKSTLYFAPDEDVFVSYDYPTYIVGHDVNKDGATNRDDVQAVLDYLAGNVEGDKLDLAVAEMDGVDGISSYDAELLLQWLLDEGVDYIIVPAGESVRVTVNIQLAGGTKQFLDYYYTSGAYIEGFTYLFPATETEDGELLDVVYSIPLLGFYGSWTDASMFDCYSLDDILYSDSEKSAYTDNYTTNYMTIDYGQGDDYFFGNPYIVEDSYPADRLAINPATKIVNIKYNLIRNAGSTGWLALDSENNVIGGALGGAQYGAYYYVNGGSWQNTTTSTAKINTTPDKLGLINGDQFTIGFFAIPEYYGAQLHPEARNGRVTEEDVTELLNSGELGAGAYVGYTLTVDAFKPEVISATLSEDGNAITVKAKDNQYIAYASLMDYSGSEEFAWGQPEQTEPGEEVEITFDITDMDLPNGLAVFVADYAKNERAYLVVLDPEKPVSKTVWMLTDTLEEGKEYVITNAAEGTAYALDSLGANYYTSAAAVEIVNDKDGAYIPYDSVYDSSVWVASEGIVLTNKNDGGVLGYNDSGEPFVCWANPSYADSFSYIDGMLYNFPDYDMGLFFQAGRFYFYTAGPVYLFTPVEVEVDPYSASSVSVTPSAATLILDVLTTVQLVANVEPIVLPDLSVTWSSSDEAVATVDENGRVTAVGVGSAIITATSNQTPEVFGTALIQVTGGEPMDGVVYGMVETKEGVQYGPINLNDMSLEDISGGNIFSSFYGGGRSGDFIYGNDIDNDFHRYNVEEGFAYDSDFHFVISDSWAAYDIAGFPSFAIADYSGVESDEDEPEITEYNRVFAALNGSGYLYFMDDEGSLIYFDLSDLGNFIALTFAGVSIDEDDGLPNLYYILLADDGSLIMFGVYPKLSTGGMSAWYDELGHINVLSIGEDHKAYSLSYYEDEETYGVFVADNTIGGIYWVDLTEVDEAGEVDAHFVGKVAGAETLSSLSDFYFDTIDYLGVIPVGLPEEEGSDALPGTKLAEAAASLPSPVMILESAEASLFDPADEDIVIAGDDEIVIVGGLDSVKTETQRNTAVLNAAELLNPETYPEDGVVAIAVTAPSEGAGDEIYNGLVTVKYDPAALVLASFQPVGALEYKSFKVDESEGLITFAFASTYPVAAGEALASLTFSGLMQDTVVTVTTIEANDVLDLNDVTEIELQGAGFNLALSASTAGVQLAWDAVDGAEKYEAQVLAGDEWKTVATVEELSCIDADVLMAETYTYRVRAFKNGAWTGFCEEQSIFFNPFVDVSGKKTIEYVAWAYNNGVIVGTTETTFEPDLSCSRAQFVMMLWKASGSPVVQGELPFSDVTGAKTTKALLWALDAGIINSAAKFNPNGTISREQVVMILWKMAGSPKAEGEFPFTDVEGAKTQKAVLWAYQNGIVKGTSDTTFSPKDDCTRVQLVVLLYKFDQVVGLLPKA